MTEMIYEEGKTEPKKRRPLPNNRRQIGQPGREKPEVFIEDYAYAFAKNLAECDYAGCVVGVLVGEKREEEEGQIFVYGVLEARNVVLRDVICFTEENWTEIYRDIREYFPGQQIVGWYLGGPGFLLEDTERQKKIQADNFGGGDKILFKVDSLEKKQTVWFYREGELRELPGYYIYYEKNEEMQNYIAQNKKVLPLERKDFLTDTSSLGEGKGNSRGVVEYSAKNTGEGRVQSRTSRTKGFYSLFYATSGVLTCLAILVIAGLAMQIRERDQLKHLLNEKKVSSMQQVYVVEEGETIKSICIKFYGSTEQEDAIRLLNSLEKGEEPEAGRKIFLP